MRLIGHLLRFYSYIFETVLCGAGLLLGGFALVSSNVDVRVPWLPWNGVGQMRWIIGLSILGICSVALAAFGTVRALLFLFSATVVGVLMRGFFINTQYTFPGREGARDAGLLILGALLAWVGSYPGFGGRRRRT